MIGAVWSEAIRNDYIGKRHININTIEYSRGGVLSQCCSHWVSVVAIYRLVDVSLCAR